MSLLPVFVSRVFHYAECGPLRTYSQAVYNRIVSDRVISVKLKTVRSRSAQTQPTESIFAFPGENITRTRAGTQPRALRVRFLPLDSPYRRENRPTYSDGGDFSFVPSVLIVLVASTSPSVRQNAFENSSATNIFYTYIGAREFIGLVAPNSGVPG